MDSLYAILQIILHLDQHLALFVHDHGAWVYVLLFLIIFAETGLVVMPVMPGDSLLFVAGALAGAGTLDPALLALSLAGAAVAGDAVNYGVGHWLGPKVVRGAGGRFINRRHLEVTHAFYERHGGKTVIVARFLPVLRTFAPFVAGVGRMAYRRFAAFNILGALLWVGSLVGAGFFFGNFPWVRGHLSVVIVGVIVLSLLPGAVAYLRSRLSARTA